MIFFCFVDDKVWNYVWEILNLFLFFNWVLCGMNLFECCVFKGWLLQVVLNQDDGSYMMKDFFELYFMILKVWKYVVCWDDMLNLEIGEMFNFVSIEGSICFSKDVIEVVVFGVGCLVFGVLIVLVDKLVGKFEEEILERVWFVVELVCCSVEVYVCISKFMIKIFLVGCEYFWIDKGSVICQVFYRNYVKEIDEIYDKVEFGGSDFK